MIEPAPAPQRDPRWLVAAAVLAAVTVGLAVAVAAGWLGPHSVDGHIVGAAHRLALREHWTAAAARACTRLGVPIDVDALALIVTVGLLLCRRFRAAGFVAAVRFVTALTSSEAKLVVHRHRPSLPHPIVHASGYSFPSGHAAAAASLYLPLAVLLLSSRRSAIRRGTVGLALVVCVVVSMSRVVLGVHFPSDVIAGFALGAAFTCAGVWLFVPIPASGEATSRPAAATDINTIG